MEADIIITITIAAGIVLVIGHFARILQSYALQRTIREAIKIDSAATPVLLERIGDFRNKGPGDDRIAVVLLALGAALAGFGILAADADKAMKMAGVALFPTFLGLALLLRLWVIRRQGRRN